MWLSRFLFLMWSEIFRPVRLPALTPSQICSEKPCLPLRPRKDRYIQTVEETIHQHALPFWFNFGWRHNGTLMRSWNARELNVHQADMQITEGVKDVCVWILCLYFAWGFGLKLWNIQVVWTARSWIWSLCLSSTDIRASMADALMGDVPIFYIMITASTRFSLFTVL